MPGPVPSTGDSPGPGGANTEVGRQIIKKISMSICCILGGGES